MKRTAASVAMLLVALLLGYMVLSAFEGDRDAEPTPSPHAFGTAQRQAFDVLRGATRPIPPALRSRLRQARNRTIRTLWLDAARYVPNDGSDLWMVNGRGSTCIVQARGAAVSCVPRAALLRNGVALGVVDLGPPPERKAEEFIVAGVVPDSIEAVDAKVGDEMRSVEVRNNAYALRAAVPIVVKRFER